ncbi:MAG: EutN/CcmL family microcompartment protein [Anaerolineae bacterium]|nr:EutN/CcmL family microcompartment protein [Anaerolineae bacterium]
MLLGKVVGTVVSTRKDPKIEGLRFMIVKQIDVEGVETGNYVIAADAVGAGVGEIVLYATGSSARQTVLTDRRPIDGVIMAIVDMWEVGGAMKYHKYREVGEGDEA